MRTHFPEKAVPSGSECGKQYERITAGRLAYEKWVEADEPDLDHSSPHIIKIHDKAYADAMEELHIATERRNKHVQMLKTSLALIAPLLNIDLSSQLLPTSQFLK